MGNFVRAGVVALVFVGLIAGGCDKKKSGGGPLVIQQTNLDAPIAAVGQAYSVTLSPEGGTAPFTWSITPALPAGLSLDQATGVISGTPSVVPTPNPYTGTVRVVDATGRVEEGPITLAIRSQTDLASAASDGALALGGANSDVRLSEDGRYAVFVSSATNLVPNDTNGVADIFLKDRQTEQVTRLSVGQGGVQADGASDKPAMSPDGRFIVFHSTATNLVPGDTNSSLDVFLFDRQTSQIERVSLSNGGAQGDDESGGATVGEDGRYVAFDSDATNLVAGDTNGFADVFIRDRQAATTTRVSVVSGGAQAVAGNSVLPVISEDGNIVAFESEATNLVAGDSNGAQDVFVHDRQAGTTTRVSVATGGAQGDGASQRIAMSGDGRFVAFQSVATNLVAGDTNATQDVFVVDRQLNQTERVSVSSASVQGNEPSGQVSISGDGRYVAFESNAGNLVTGDGPSSTDVFLRDRQTSQTTRISATSGGATPNGASSWPSISGDGRFVAYQTAATDLIPSDTNGVQDVLVSARP